MSKIWQVLIETYWNVKTDRQNTAWINRDVLIETYWNVKDDIHYLIDNDLIVLIETYWNVKSTRSSNITALTSGINRNILECKGAYLICIPFCVYCINRNILECKVIHTKRPFTVFTVLIETYWNVKCCTFSITHGGFEY